MTDHPRLTRYIPTFVGTDYAGMYKERAPGLYVPEQDPTHGPYVLASEADAEIERLRAEIELLRAEQPQDPSICGEDGPITPEECARWLETKYARHGELEDRAAAQWLRRLCAEVERLTGERDEARKPPHCINCHCEESAKGMVDLSDYLDLHRGLMAVVYESKSHAEAVLFSERALRHAESEHVISEAASSATAPNSFADQNRALVAEVANRRGITLGHLREDGGCELAQIMRRLDAAEAEVERLRGAPHCPPCGSGASEPNTPAP